MSSKERLTELCDRYDVIADEIATMRHSLNEILEVLRGQTKSCYSVAEVARVVDRSEYTVRSWITQGLLRAVRVDGTGPRGRLLVPREELERLVRGGRGGALPAGVVGNADSTEC